MQENTGKYMKLLLFIPWLVTLNYHLGYLPFPLCRALLQKGFHGADIIPQDAARLGLGAHQPAILVPHTVQVVCPDAVH